MPPDGRWHPPPVDPEAMTRHLQALKPFVEALEAAAAVEQDRARILADPARRRELPATLLALAQASEARGGLDGARHWYREALERCWLINLADDDPLVVACVDGLTRLEDA